VTPIYLDYNATTPLLPEVLDAMLPFLRDSFGNPSSAHPFGRASRDAVESAREQVATLLGCAGEEIVFTSGGTEANNLALRGVAEMTAGPGHLVTSLIEHPAVAAPCDWLDRQGWRVSRVSVDASGRVRLDDLIAAIDKRCALVSILHANGETGVLQPLLEVGRAARHAGATVHTDASQSVGKVPINVRDLQVDLLSVAGHKLYAPMGVGALYVRRGVQLAPLLRGAGQERGLRPGTENVPSVVGLGVACDLARKDLRTEGVRIARLRDRLWSQLSDRVRGLALNGHPTDRLPNTLSVRFPGVSGNAVLAAAPEVAASTGSACHAGTDQAPPAIMLMGIARSDALGTVRLTLGRRTTVDEVDRASQALARAWRQISRAVRANGSP
jgi:cysteine desulfurase